jgi:N-formylglutamate amidohydrolase
LLGAAAIPGQSAKSAVVVSCPHAGRYYPETLVTAGSVGIEALRDLEDFAVDRLLDGLSCTNIAGISSNIARAYLDVNRPEDALDPAMFDEPVSAPKQSRKVMAGYGLLPRLTGARSLIHDHLLPADEIQQRIALAYRPYHSQLKQLLDNARQQHQRYLLVDCHSMPDVDHQNKRLPDVVLGDCNGRTLAPEIGKALDDHIRALGFSLGWNNPYSGGFITGHYGAATSSGQSLQIEINRALYMRLPHQLDKDGAARVNALLTAILTFLDALAS